MNVLPMKGTIDPMNVLLLVSRLFKTRLVALRATTNHLMLV